MWAPHFNTFIGVRDGAMIALLSYIFRNKCAKLRLTSMLSDAPFILSRILSTPSRLTPAIALAFDDR